MQNITHNTILDFLLSTITHFLEVATIPSEGAVTFGSLPGIGWSDHWSFWQKDIPAIMITDTAPFRYPHYHTPEDTINKINFPALSRVTAGLQYAIIKLAND
jgi:hypothetical protein